MKLLICDVAQLRVGFEDVIWLGTVSFDVTDI
jgi:hypothetical protein